MNCRVEAELHPTEEPEKVSRAILNIFPEASLEISDNKISGKSSDFGHLKRKISDQKIIDTARGIFLAGSETGVLRFWLNKQAAFAGKVNFTEGSAPLGDIFIEISGDAPEAIIDELAPRREAFE